MSALRQAILESIMPSVTPIYDRETVNRAGRILINPAGHSEAQQEHALLIIGNWRSSHSFPLNTFKLGLLKRARHVDGTSSLVAQRLKRISSIGWKLIRFGEMKLSQMQDIAGCRAIVSSVAHVDALVKRYKKSDIKHKLIHEDDYIRQPKPSGYRGVHLIYKYFSDRQKTYNDLKVEIQLRSLRQHAWATAVETVGIFTQQALKSSQGEEDWLRFFALMGTAIALREGTAGVPDTPTEKKALKSELRDYVNRLDVLNHLSMFAAVCDAPEISHEKGAHYFLLELDTKARRITVTGYKQKDLEKASDAYLNAERHAAAPDAGRDAVLVAVDSFKALKKAYPNYFLDTHRFINEVRQAVGQYRQ